MNRRTLVLSGAIAAMATTVPALAQSSASRINKDDYYLLTDDDLLWLCSDANAFRGQLIALDCESGGVSPWLGSFGQDIDDDYAYFSSVARTVSAGGTLQPFIAYLVTNVKKTLAPKKTRPVRVYGKAVGTYVLPQPIMKIPVVPVFEIHLTEDAK